MNYKFKETAENVYDALLQLASEIVANSRHTFQPTAEFTGNLKEVSRWLTSPDTKYGLMLGGMFGNGKTVTLKAIRELMKQCTLNPDNSHIFSQGTMICKAKELVEDVEMMNKAKGITWLLIDELGEEPTVVKTWGNSTTPIIDLIEYRYENEMPTIATTNLSKKEVENKYMGRVADRIRDMFNTIIYRDKSFRG